MAAPRKWSDETRQAIHELVNEQGRQATDIGPILQARGLAIPPLETIRTIARATRHDITDKPKADQLHTLIAGIVKATDAEITRIQAESSDDAPDQLLKLARTIREIEPLLSEKPRGKDTDRPTGTLATLHGAASANQEGRATLPVSSHVAS